MNRFFYPGVITSPKIQITDQEEIKHIDRVLRLKIGEEVEICDTAGRVFVAVLLDIQKKEVTLLCGEEDTTMREMPIEVDLYQGLPKGSKMDVIIQKNVELGIHAIRAVEFTRCVSRIKDSFDSGKLDRWQKIADEASKQAKRNKRTVIEKAVHGRELSQLLSDYDLVLVAYEKATQSLKAILKEQSPKRVAIVIGPEGGFEADEVEVLQKAGAKVVSLGARILRTETAAMCLLSNLSYAYENQGE
jgi:16S rRNA (uracil1498-N3)-methyltransferase